jgi:glycogen synthase kinase 3 beta
MQTLLTRPHPNVILLKQSFESRNAQHSTNRSAASHNRRGGKQQNEALEEVYLHLVLEYVPETLYSLTRYYRKQRHGVIPHNLVKLYTFQLMRALAHIHGMNICHRDVKPENVLVDPVKNIVKLCDFGSSKVLVPNEPNIPYICSRFYRAPELILGNDRYSTAVDVWSAGCVLAEMLQGTPLFPGSSNVDQLVEIIKVLGTPTKEQLVQLNPGQINIRVPPMQLCSWNSILPYAPEEAVDLLKMILKYVPTERITAIDACCVKFFEEIRSPTYLLPSGLPISSSMQGNFTNEELKFASPSTIDLLVHKSVTARNSSSIETVNWRKTRSKYPKIEFSDD